MKKKTTTQKYIEAAVEQAKDAGLGGHTISNCSIHMPLEIGDAAEMVAKAIEAQAKANEKTASALLELAAKLKLTDACAIRIER